jgi:GT2 family glycosyltransferase/glycosyltransferase involved in cell wall biosynthesis
VNVEVVVVSHESAGVLDDCLRSLGPASRGIDHHVTVVDNASTDRSVAIASAFAGVEVVALANNGGYAAAINAGLHSAPSADAVLVLNPDVRLAAGAVGRLVAALAEPAVGIAVPVLHGPDGEVAWSLRREPTIRRAVGEALLGARRAGARARWGELVVDPAAYRRRAVADWATGAAMCISRRCLDTVGPWDESFFLYSEETDYALRARDAGFQLVLVPEAAAVHLGGDSEHSPGLHARMATSRVRLYKKRHGPCASAVYHAVVTLHESSRALLDRPAARAAVRALTGRAGPLASPSSPPGWLCFAASDWWYHNRAHSEFQLMLEIARTRQVLVVNSIGMRVPLPGRTTQPLHRIARKVRSALHPMATPVADRPRFHVLSPVFLPLYNSAWGRGLNAALVRAQVERAQRRLGIVDPVLFVTLPTAYDIVRRIPRRALVFNRSDKHSSFTEVRRTPIEQLERRLLTESDLVVYVSEALQRADTEARDAPAYFLDHGVDLDHFAAEPGRALPRDLATIPSPRIGFFGGIDDYVFDEALVERVAKELPDAQIVLIGTSTMPLDGLTALPNVHHLGFRPYAEIPAYGAAFDVGIMPWLATEWIHHCNPVKLKEYLALGIPVVTVRYPDAERYAHVIAIADDHEEFVDRVRDALDGRPVADADARRAAVRDATWAGRARALREATERAGDPAACAAS